MVQTTRAQIRLLPRQLHDPPALHSPDAAGGSWRGVSRASGDEQIASRGVGDGGVGCESDDERDGVQRVFRKCSTDLLDGEQCGAEHDATAARVAVGRDELYRGDCV